MSSNSHDTPPFFKRGLPPSARLTIYLAMSFALLVTDLRMHYLEPLRQGVAILTYPLQIAATTPAEFVSNASNYFSGLISLQRENARLKAQQLKVSSQILLNEQLRQENENLRGLLQMQAQIKIKSTAAEILFAARDPFSRKVVLDKGSAQSIEPGAPVVDPQGVIGQVTRVYPLHSEVTLLSDKDQAIPVMVERSGLRAVMFGTGNGLMELRYLAANADVRPGDRILTSGLDGVYVAGLPVATILKVGRDSAESFARILCRPIGTVERTGAVLVLAQASVRPAMPSTATEAAEDSRRSSSGRVRKPANAATSASAPVARNTNASNPPASSASGNASERRAR
ncbi:rod shape-determining protein MreC [Uliginosibacterium gangwonense]|uniref:rod shape-determining protein MreC n=1 Tax=Uliginosibacterium gangwonense TaxID=392736 RepID=UPI000382F19F|nr:rod shape-determining protein MreC [Uliginosibacterium gangwonense]